ncbi:hypothetical protein, partial [Cecembia sp.]|uniref:hypothetical protein n=1 Tax=Cecembia sp. TaxID=1898110 RepID=UPI0025C148A9
MNKAFLFLFFIYFFSCKPKQEKFPAFPVVGYIQLENSILEISEIGNGLQVPWDISTSIENEIWFTQVNGSVHVLDLT